MIIRFIMSKGKDVLLDGRQAEQLLDSPNQIVKITGEDGRWSGLTINKAHIVDTVRDYDEETYENKRERDRYLREMHEKGLLLEQKSTPEDEEKVNKIKDDIRRQFPSRRRVP